MSPFEATVEILKVRLSKLETIPKEDESEKVSKYAETIYNKLRELHDKDSQPIDFETNF